MKKPRAYLRPCPEGANYPSSADMRADLLDGGSVSVYRRGKHVGSFRLADLLDQSYVMEWSPGQHSIFYPPRH